MKADPMYGGVGDFVGSAMLAAPVMGAAAPFGVAAGVGSAAAAGGAFSDPGERGTNTAIGAAAGVAGEAGKRLLPKAAHYLGNKFLNNVSGRISPKNNLSTASTNAAYEAGAIRPWRSIKGAAGALEDATDAAGARVGNSVRDIGRTTGATVDAKQLSDEFLHAGRAIQSQSMNPAEYKPYFWAAEEVLVKGKGGQIPLETAEALKTSVYGRAKPAYGTVQGADVPATPGAWRDIGSRVRVANEKAAQAVAAPEQMTEFLAAKKGYGPLREAFKVAGEGAARAGNRSFLSLPDALMLAEGGLGASAAFKAARTLLPQTLGYGAWRGGQAMSNPGFSTLVKTMALEAARKESE